MILVFHKWRAKNTLIIERQTKYFKCYSGEGEFICRLPITATGDHAFQQKNENYFRQGIYDDLQDYIDRECGRIRRHTHEG